MPQKAKYQIINDNTGAWLQLDSTVQGKVSCYLWTDNANQPRFVTNAVDAAAAATEASALRYFHIPASGGNAGVRFDLDPCKTWVRSSTASASTLHCHMEW